MGNAHLTGGVLQTVYGPVPYHGGEVHPRTLNLHGIFRKSVLLHGLNIVVYAGGQCQNQGDADDADGPGEGGQQGSGFFCAKIVKAEGKRGPKGHGGFSHVPVDRGRLPAFFRLVGIGIGTDFAVLQLYDPGGILLGQLRVVGHHDHQTVFGDLFQQLHHLYAGFAVQGAGWFVRQQNVRIIDQRPGDGHPLHLSAGHLAGLLVQLLSQSHLLQGSLCPLAPLCPGDAGNGQGQLHIGQDGLVGNQIVALEYEADGMVSVGIPIPILIFPGGNPVDDQLSAVIAVKSADDIQQCGFSGAAGAENGDEFIIPEIQADAVQRRLNQRPGFVLLENLFDLKHACHLVAGLLLLLYMEYHNRASTFDEVTKSSFSIFVLCYNTEKALVGGMRCFRFLWWRMTKALPDS